MSLTVLMNAGPWLPVPPNGYGGIENVVATLTTALRGMGVRVVLATVGDSTLPADERISYFRHGQFEHLLEPYNRVSGLAHAHQQRVLTELRRRDDIDLVHDHVEVVGPSTLAGTDIPALHTLHWDPRRHADFYTALDGGPHLRVNGVSRAQLATAPAPLLARSVGHVHLATPLADRAAGKPVPHKEDHVVVLGRITPCKGQHVAIRVAARTGLPLVLAGPVGPYRDRSELDAALRTNPDAATHPDVRYFLDEIAAHVDGGRVSWPGSLCDAERAQVVGTARAALFPIEWEEPGGTAMIESLALACPVIGYRRGCLPELVDHGRTGLLADPGDEDRLAAHLLAAGTIDPAVCAREAARRFTPRVMARRYLQLYRQILASANPGGEPTDGDGLAVAPGTDRGVTI
jgi:glycosyltransferase involved in cell wall biosynthesis